MLKVAENLQINCEYEEKVCCVICDRDYCESYGVLINHLFPVSGL